MALQKLTITEPLVDDNFKELEAAAEHIKLTENDNDSYEIHVDVHSREMVPTALFFALKKRFNTQYTATVGDFPSNYFVFSFLKSSHFLDVQMKDLTDV